MRTWFRALIGAAVSSCLSFAVPAVHAAESDAVCTAAPATAKWSGRASDDAWAPGLYPAREDYPKDTVALTFDDGPHRSRTAIALDELAARDWTGAFFLTGSAIRSSTYHLVQRIVAEGHELGNHAWRHDVRMALRFDDPAQLESYMAAEFELTQVRVDLAMLATSKDDFLALSRTVFDGLTRRATPQAEIAAMPALRARHAVVLAEHGYVDGERPHRIRWARPPGGNPYLGKHSSMRRDAFARALASQGLELVMWNGGSGDSNPTIPADERRDATRLTKTVTKAARRGGIYVMHDRIAPASLRTVLAAFEARGTTITSLAALRRGKLTAQGRCVEPTFEMGPVALLRTARGTTD